MTKLASAFLAGAALFCSGTAIADDSSAALGAGGIVLTQSADIRMVAEDLYVSPKSVRIRFEFANDSGKDIDTMVAFPLPDIDTYKFWGEAIGTTTTDPVNFVGFEVLSDGKPVPVRVEQRAIYEGRDVTDIVKSAGLPVNMTVGNGAKLADNLSKAKLAILEHAGLVERDPASVSADAPNGSTISKWLARTKFYWQQHFPAGKTVVLEERYQPVTGQALFSQYEVDGKGNSAYWLKNYCIDGATRSAAAIRIAASKKASPLNGGLLNAYSTDYILVTGNNWKGPMGASTSRSTS